jgi:hypothetical protein
MSCILGRDDRQVNTQLWWGIHAAQGDGEHGVVCKGAIQESNGGLVLPCRLGFTNRDDTRHQVSKH